MLERPLKIREDRAELEIGIGVKEIRGLDWEEELELTLWLKPQGVAIGLGWWED